MRLGETITGNDLAAALAGESGKFEVVSPTNETYIVTCVPGHSIANLTLANTQMAQPFVIRKVANLGSWDNNSPATRT
jgi:hypothetical protein